MPREGSDFSSRAPSKGRSPARTRANIKLSSFRSSRDRFPCSSFGLNVDPWQEAANLARLPGETATQRLASLISALPDDPSGHLEPGLIARLVALLPSGTGFNIRSHEKLLDPGAVIKSRAAIVAIYVIFMVLVLTAQSFIAVRQLPAQGRQCSGSGAGLEHSLLGVCTAKLRPMRQAI